MTDRRKKIKASYFYKRLAVYVLILALLIGAVLFAMNKWAAGYQSRYESAQEAEIPNPEPTFLEFIADADADYWADLWISENPDCIESRENIVAYMQELFLDGKTVFYKAEDFSSETPKYIVRRDTERLADVTLVLMADNTWSVRTVSTYIEGTCSGSITLPAGCTVYCNGSALDKAFSSSAETDPFPSAEYLEKRINPVSFETWTVSGLLYQPEFTYEPPSSDKLWVDSSSSILVQLNVSDDTVYLEKAKLFFDAFIEFFRSGCVNTSQNANNAKIYTLLNSAAYNDITNITHGVFLSRYYKEYTRESSFGPIVKWADNFISVDVTFSLYAESDGEVLDNSGIYRILLESTDSGWLVVDYALVG